MEFYIRPIKSGDAEGLNKLRRMPGVFENISGLPSERIQQNEDFVVNMDANQHQFVAISKLESNEELIIGTAGLFVNGNHRRRHCGTIGIMIHKDYQSKGVGTALIAALIDIADNWLMLVRLELTVFEDNKNAIYLYEKFGFEKEGLKRFAAIRKGKYENECVMARINFTLYSSLKS
ncbi:putative acetyltransferase [Carnobacterium iners]|uniref:Putative acetyltransferase n=1 Tax=Carnobacterium iners TaxID=1073423 RepID=A0A1X7MQV0_9LACT|nr:GNAT family N-acetyltransferase [Carnobacterium iners]SEL33949.1 putative acetyltransferase [Carnobacterium iners]SMH26994.1 putative acetyltransferase [Carnobacterium iners]